MQLLDHVSITVRSLNRAKPFYVAVMAALGAKLVYERRDAIGFGERNRPDSDGHTYLSVFESAQAAADPRRHWCFRARSVAQVAAFHAAGLAAGGTDEGAPGLRPAYHPGYFAAFVLDPEGNRIEAVCHRAGQAVEAGPFDADRSLQLAENDRAELERLEESLWRAGTRFDRQRMERVIAEDFFEFGRSGRTYSRADTLAIPRVEPEVTFPLPRLRIRLLAPDVAQVTYDSAVAYDGVVEHGRRCSIWSRRGGSWVLRFHQGTPYQP
jgi:catechol 2,3-dioxygenase-like lactoylglutathione lyase family enzyme